MNVTTLCLGSLCLGDATGYDIKKLFEATFSHFHSASYGSIYPALSRLQGRGLIELRVEPGERHPDRKIYHITRAGREAFLQELSQAEPGEQLRSDFLVLLFFAHLLPTERLSALLDQVMARYRGELDHLRSIHGRPEHTAGIRLSIELGIAALGAKLKLLEEKHDVLLREHTTTHES